MSEYNYYHQSQPHRSPVEGGDVGDLSLPAGRPASPYSRVQSHIATPQSQYNAHDYHASGNLQRNASVADSLSPYDSASQIGEEGTRASGVYQYSRNSYLTQDPYVYQDPYAHYSTQPTPFASSQHLADHQEEWDPAQPLVYNAAPASGYGHLNDKRQSSSHVEHARYDEPDDDLHYPPMDAEKALSKDGSRPPVWLRMLRDTTPVDQRIDNHKHGVGVQRRPWICWLLSIGMVVALIAECGENWKYQGSPIATKPIFNYMIGPSSNVLIHSGARFVPCMKDIPEVTSQNFACLNNTKSIPTSICTLEDICGFGGFKGNQPDQSFRFILPIFLHAGLVHLIFNLLVQNTAAAQIEREMGSLRFVLLYIPSGVFGFILGGNFALVGQASVGASGAIYGTEAAILVDLIAHWSIEYRPKRKLLFLIIELIVGFAIGFIPNALDNFSHIGFLCGLLMAILLYPIIHQTRARRVTVYVLRVIALVGVLLLFVLLTRNFYTSDPNSQCSWCRYLSCWPTSANNHCKGTGLSETKYVVVSQVKPLRLTLEQQQHKLIHLIPQHATASDCSN